MNLSKIAFARPHLWLGIASFVIAGSMVMQENRDVRLMTFISLMAVYQLTQIAFPSKPLGLRVLQTPQAFVRMRGSMTR